MDFTRASWQASSSRIPGEQNSGCRYVTLFFYSKELYLIHHDSFYRCFDLATPSNKRIQRCPWKPFAKCPFTWSLPSSVQVVVL